MIFTFLQSTYSWPPHAGPTVRPQSAGAYGLGPAISIKSAGSGTSLASVLSVKSFGSLAGPSSLNGLKYSRHYPEYEPFHKEFNYSYNNNVVSFKQSINYVDWNIIRWEHKICIFNILDKKCWPCWNSQVDSKKCWQRGLGPFVCWS